MKEKLQFCLDKISLIRSKLPKKKPHSEKYYKMIAFLNKYSLESSTGITRTQNIV